MKISTINNLRILTHYYAVIFDYENIFPASKRFRLIVILSDIEILICDTFFVSPEVAREHFFMFYGKRALEAERCTFEEISPNDVVWSQFTSFDRIFFKEIEAINKVLKWLADDSKKDNAYSLKGVN